MKKIKITATILLLAMLSVPLVACAKLDEGQAKIMTDNIISYELKGLSAATIDGSVKQFLSELKADGSFEGVDYGDTSQSNWKPIEHLDKLRAIARAYVLNGSEFYNSKFAFDAVSKGLRYWLDFTPKSTNWYYASIGNPHKYAPTLILIDSLDYKLDDTLRKDFLKYWKSTGDKPENWTGANTVDIALHWLYRGVYTKSLGLVNRAIKNAYGVIKVTDKEGIQQDNSYQQHGAQIYNLGYGNSILTAITAYGQVTAGTKFAIPASKLKILSDFVINGYITAFRGQYGLYNQDGRGVSRINSVDKSSCAKALSDMAKIDTANAQTYLDAVDRINGNKSIDYAINNRNQYFYKSDYALQYNKAYSFDVRMASSRTCRTEWGNRENTKGYFMSDGGYSLYKSGKEYYNIFPLWNWSMIPGVTAPQIKDIPLGAEWSQKGVSKFTGGLSAGEFGLATYSYYDSYMGVNTGAKKSYFMLGDEIICLGSSINSSNENRIFTTVNQVNYNGEYSVNGKLASGNTPSRLSQNDTLVHDGVGYVNLSQNDMIALYENRSGNWQDINYYGGSNIAEGQVFSVYFDHGVKPNGADYAYSILPQYYSGQTVNTEILINEGVFQLVKRSDLGIYAGVFHAAGNYNSREFSIKIDNSCAFMIVGNKIYISEPTQKVKKLNIEITLNGKSSNITVKFGGKNVVYGSTYCGNL